MATVKKKSGGTLKSKAKSRAGSLKPSAPQQAQNIQAAPPPPAPVSQPLFDTPPPLPPTFTFLKALSQIPGLRKREREGGS